MTLIVEDGSGLANAESYISVADADTRITNLGLTTPWSDLAETDKEAALRRATQFMLECYRERWTGYRVKVDQRLDWPRYGVEVDSWYVAFDIVPTDIANACAALAFKAASGDLNADLVRGVVRKKVGPIETEYDRFSPQAVRYRSIDMALSPYLKRSGASATLIRT